MRYDVIDDAMLGECAVLLWKMRQYHWYVLSKTLDEKLDLKFTGSEQLIYGVESTSYRRSEACTSLLHFSLLHNL